MSAYYNEFDPFAAQWLRNLIAAGHIAPGDVDERSILEVSPDDVRGYRQAHFFAGIGIWSLALRAAGWDDDRPIWTGSCPCQPFSAAGKGKGHEDERHLWPVWFRLIRECAPSRIAGEQVAGHDGYAWWDSVASDLEGESYAVGAVSAPAGAFGGFHRRQRLYWMAQPDEGKRRQGRHGPAEAGAERAHGEFAGRGDPCGVADDLDAGRRRIASSWVHERRPGACSHESAAAGADGACGHDVDGCGASGLLADSVQSGWAEGRAESGRGSIAVGGDAGLLGNATARGWTWERGAWEGRASEPGSARWHLCTDGKRRPVPAEPSFFPLVDGPSGNRVGILRASGNGLYAPQAAAFCRAMMELTR